jgi:hypothetical protein
VYDTLVFLHVLSAFALVSTVVIFSAFALVIAYLVTVWAMTTKPV